MSGGRGAARPGALKLPDCALECLERALKKEFLRYRKIFRECKRKHSEKGVHAFRVSVRRLSALMDLLAPMIPKHSARETQTALKHHLNAFDALRDTQVGLQLLGRKSAMRQPAADFREYLESRRKRFTRKAFEEARNIKIRRLGERVDSCLRHIRRWRRKHSAKRANQMLARGVFRAYERALKQWKQIRVSDSLTIHRTRVAFKHYRYMMEVLAELGSVVNPSRLNSMHGYQRMMGRIQDVHVLLEVTAKFFGKAQAQSKSARRFWTSWLRRRDALICLYMKSAPELLEFGPGM